MNDSEFLAALEDCSLPKEYFDHRGHLRAAWSYLERYPLPEAARRCAASIRTYAGHLGATGKFHLTLTLAFMHIVAELREAHPAADWQAFLAACPTLVEQPRSLLARHYRPETLQSERARDEFVAPDIAPLPLMPA